MLVGFRRDSGADYLTRIRDRNWWLGWRSFRSQAWVNVNVEAFRCCRLRKCFNGLGIYVAGYLEPPLEDRGFLCVEAAGYL